MENTNTHLLLKLLYFYTVFYFHLTNSIIRCIYHKIHNIRTRFKYLVKINSFDSIKTI